MNAMSAALGKQRKQTMIGQTISAWHSAHVTFDACKYSGSSSWPWLNSKCGALELALLAQHNND